MQALVACLAAALGFSVYAEERTVVNESLFSLSLPGKWRATHDREAQSWQYLSTDGREAVTVGVLHRTGGTSPEVIEANFQAYLHARRESELNLSERRVRLTEPEVQQRGSAVIGRWVGIDAPNNRRTLTLVIVNEAVAGSFYYEALELTAAAFEARAKVVFAEVGLVGK